MHLIGFLIMGAIVISFIVALVGAVVLVAIVHMVKREPMRTAP